MTTPQQTALQLAARHLVEAQEQTAGIGRMGSYRVYDVGDLLRSLHDTLNSLGRALEAAGATAPTEGYQGTPAPSPDSLEHLRRVEESRDETQNLLWALEFAMPHAEQLDKRRGNWVGDMADTAHGETPGTDYAEAVQGLLLRLRGELGAEGSGRE
jgi:hypothetical protein